MADRPQEIDPAQWKYVDWVKATEDGNRTYPKSWDRQWPANLGAETKKILQAAHNKCRWDEIDRLHVEANEIYERKTKVMAQAKIDAQNGDNKARWLLEYVEKPDDYYKDRSQPARWHKAHDWQNWHTNIYEDPEGRFAQMKTLAEAIVNTQLGVTKSIPNTTPLESAPVTSTPESAGHSSPMLLDGESEMDISGSSLAQSPDASSPAPMAVAGTVSNPAAAQQDGLGTELESAQYRPAITKDCIRAEAKRPAAPALRGASKRLRKESSDETETYKHVHPADAISKVANSAPSLTQLSQMKISKKSKVSQAANGARSPSPSPTLIMGDEPPEWYTQIDTSKQKPNRKLDAELRTFYRDRVTACQSAKGAHLIQLFDALRDGLHTLEFQEVDPATLKAAKMLHNNLGLPQVFKFEYSKGVNYPWDIQSDARELYNKWYCRIFDSDLLRGIKAPAKNKLTNEKASWTIDPKMKRTARYHGNGLLVNGQWWPRQLCAVRDGAHGLPVGGIYGNDGTGAFSVVMSGEKYHTIDEDNGDEVWYSGTIDDRSDEDITAFTERLRESVGSGKPVRLMRSSKLHESNRFKPKEGFRYDGLYDVVEERRVPGGKKEQYQFKLVRCPNQPPIRAGGVEERPTKYELAEWNKTKKALGLSGSFD